jgi:hypothetical protein
MSVRNEGTGKNRKGVFEAEASNDYFSLGNQGSERADLQSRGCRFRWLNVEDWLTRAGT